MAGPSLIWRTGFLGPSSQNRTPICDSAIPISHDFISSSCVLDAIILPSSMTMMCSADIIELTRWVTIVFVASGIALQAHGTCVDLPIRALDDRQE